jgi:hypothetical protein
LAKTSALGGARFAEQDPVGASDEPHERFPPRLDRTQTELLAIEAQEVEGHKRGLRAAPLGHERDEVAAPVNSQRHRLAVDQRLVRILRPRTASASPRRRKGRSNG